MDQLASFLLHDSYSFSETMLLVVGTYSEKLGHVTGKGDGLYVLNIDNETLTIKTEDQEESSSSATFFGKPQLGPSSGPQGLANPTYLIAHGSKDNKSTVIYVVDEREDHPGTLRALTLDKETGELSPLGGVEDIIPADDRPSEGGACCHVMVTPDEKYVLAANYLCGSLVVVGRRADGGLNPNDVHYYRLDGKPVKRADDNREITYPGPNANRQDRSHAHMVLYSSGTESDSILVPDLGSDCIWSIPYKGADSGDGPLGTPIATGCDPVLAGGGPRHAVLHPDPNVRKVYVNYELTSLVACFDIDEKTGAIVSSSAASYARPTVCNVLAGIRSDSFFRDVSAESASEDCKKMYERFLQRDDVKESGVPTSSDEKTSTAAIRITPDGSHVLVSSRIVDGEGAISALSLQKNGDLSQQIPAKIRGVIGKTPRDFVLTGREKQIDPAVISAAQDTDEIVVLREGEEPVLLTKNAPTPVCLCVVPTP